MNHLTATREQGLALTEHLRQAAFVLAYLLAGLGLALFELVAAALALISRPEPAWRLLELERSLANRLLGTHIPPLSPGRPQKAPVRRQLTLLAWKLPATAVAAAAAAVPIALTGTFLVWALEGFSGQDGYLGPWSLGVPLGLVLLALAAPAVVVCAAVLNGTGAVAAGYATRALSPPEQANLAVREALAARLGDGTLTIAYWLPERQRFVDERGEAVALPGPGAAQAWTPVERDGRRVAAIIHDARLRARPELVEAAAAGAVLALENERLKADLRARVQELTASRRRIIEISAETRRRIERNLHDGAQQHLVLLGLKLGLARRAIDHDPDAARTLHEELQADLDEALRELRELAQGIHPPLLSSDGLGAAVRAAAERASVPVSLELELDRRLSPGVESGAYFVVAEALTNIAKYARASRAKVRLVDTGSELQLEVRDDGVGGADPRRGSGLSGLADRVGALDGELKVDSPPGGPTIISARLPCPAESGP